MPSTLLRATIKPAHKLAEEEVLTATLKDNGLGAIMKNLNIIDVDGDHYSIMENENLKIVAKEINKIGVGRQLRANGMNPT